MEAKPHRHISPPHGHTNHVLLAHPDQKPNGCHVSPKSPSAYSTLDIFPTPLQIHVAAYVPNKLLSFCPLSQYSIIFLFIQGVHFATSMPANIVINGELSEAWKVQDIDKFMIQRPLRFKVFYLIALFWAEYYPESRDILSPISMMVSLNRFSYPFFEHTNLIVLCFINSIRKLRKFLSLLRDKLCNSPGSFGRLNFSGEIWFRLVTA